MDRTELSAPRTSPEAVLDHQGRLAWRPCPALNRSSELAVLRGQIDDRTRWRKSK
jgi:hypothetical protein